MSDPFSDQVGVPAKGDVIQLFARHVSSGKAAFFKNAGIDFVIGRREGPYLWDLAGEKQLIDCRCNGGVFNLGHRNPEIIDVLVDSLKRHDIGNHHLISEARAMLAARLARLTPPGLTYTVFGVGGRGGDRPGHQGGERLHTQGEGHLGQGRLSRPHRAGACRGGREVPGSLWPDAACLCASPFQ